MRGLSIALIGGITWTCICYVVYQLNILPLWAFILMLLTGGIYLGALGAMLDKN